MADEEKKIIIDEDWKSQVEREREEEQRKREETQAAGGEQGPGNMPEASLPFLISTLSAQILSSLGQFPDPVIGKPVIRLDYAKLNIDTLAVLQEKTKGNLTDEEDKMLEQTLHELRMLYLAIETEVSKLSPEDIKKMTEELNQQMGGQAPPGGIELGS